MSDSASEALPEATFLNFLSGLASQALIQLGEIPHPESGDRITNLPFARYTIDILTILQRKTAAECDAEETAYFKAMLQDLEARWQRSQASS